MLVGETITVFVVALPALALHVKVLAPLAVRMVLLPEQIVDVPLTLRIGIVFKNIATLFPGN